MTEASVKFSKGQVLDRATLPQHATSQDQWASGALTPGRHSAGSDSPVFLLEPELAGEAAPTLRSGRYHVRNWHRRPTDVVRKQFIYLQDAIHIGQSCMLDDQGRCFPESTPHERRAARGEGLVFRNGTLEVLEDVTVTKQVEEPVLFIGFATGQFGHFLLELVSRLWMTDWARSAGIRIAAYAPHGQLVPFQEEILGAFGINSENLLLFSGPMRFKELFMPSPLYRLHHGAHPDVMPLYRRVADHLLPEKSSRSKRLYLSRRLWTMRRVLTNELEVEELFRSFGFDVIHPEALPFKLQLEHAFCSSHIAAPIGSQTYLALFQETPESNSIIAPKSFVFPDDAIIATVRNAQSRFFLGKYEDEANERSREQDFSVDLKLLRASLGKWFD